jgi:hypothetical protein
LSAVVARIGQPMGERSIAGKRVYYWGSPELSSKSDREKQCQIRAIMNGDVIERLSYEGDEALWSYRRILVTEGVRRQLELAI